MSSQAYPPHGDHVAVFVRRGEDGLLLEALHYRVNEADAEAAATYATQRCPLGYRLAALYRATPLDKQRWL